MTSDNSEIESEDGDDCRFIASPSGTVHERDEWMGDAHEFNYHPKCGQRLPVGSQWSKVPADNTDEMGERFGHLTPCTKCFDGAWGWDHA